MEALTILCNNAHQDNAAQIKSDDDDMKRQRRTVDSPEERIAGQYYQMALKWERMVE